MGKGKNGGFNTQLLTEFSLHGFPLSIFPA